MATYLPYVYGFVAGAACMGLWWWWINHRAKARAALQTVEQVAQQIGKKL